jgi:branched-chain amino acid transport system permease protein
VPRIAWHLLLILLPVVAAFAILPGLYSNHLMLFNFIIFMTLAQGINVIYGFTGYLPFGYVGFFGAGAYGFSLMVIHLHAPPLIALPVGAAAAIVLALLLTPLFRLSGAFSRSPILPPRSPCCRWCRTRIWKRSPRAPTASVSAGSSIRR